MPRPTPLPENTKIRTTVSLAARLVAAANAYRVAHPNENLPDFSAVVAEALTEFMEKHHPGLIAAAIDAIRRNPTHYEAAEQEVLAVAEDKQAPYGKGHANSDLDRVIEEASQKQAAGAGAIDAPTPAPAPPSSKAPKRGKKRS